MEIMELREQNSYQMSNLTPSDSNQNQKVTQFLVLDPTLCSTYFLYLPVSDWLISDDWSHYVLSLSVWTLVPILWSPALEHLQGISTHLLQMPHDFVEISWKWKAHIQKVKGDPPVISSKNNKSGFARSLIVETPGLAC